MNTKEMLVLRIKRSESYLLWHAVNDYKHDCKELSEKVIHKSEKDRLSKNSKDAGNLLRRISRLCDFEK